MFKYLFLAIIVFVQQLTAGLSQQALEEQLIQLQQAGKLDGTVLIANEANPLIYLDNARDMLDPKQGIHGQYVIGSVGKQMMAVALLKALYDTKKGTELERIEQVRSDLDCPLLDFLGQDDKIWPQVLPEWAGRITPHQLLCHQSGVPEYTRFSAFHTPDANGRHFEETPHTTRQILEIIANEPLDFEPGTDEVYSNTGYTLVKELIRAVSGMEAIDYINKELFSKLGMDESYAPQNGSWQTLRLEFPYLLTPLRYDPTTKSQALYMPRSLPDVAGSGPLQIISTAYDLLKWNLALHKEKRLLVSGLYELLVYPHSWGPTNDGYGYGLAREKTCFGFAYSHSAGGARLIYIPDTKMSIIVLSHVQQDFRALEELINNTEYKDLDDREQINSLFDTYPPQIRGFEAIVGLINRYLE